MLISTNFRIQYSFICVHVYSVYVVCAHVSASTHDHVCMETKEDVQCLSVLFSLYSFNTGSLPEDAGNQKAPGISLSPSSIVLSLQAPLWPYSAFYVGARHLGLNLHACITVDLTR